MNTNYRTLHKDIGLIQRSNDCWDLWFDNGDLVSATDFHSLQVGIILACLTSWNYMNRYGNPTYQIFGNRAYELLKANKSSMVKYKIQQYFIECLKRMRRVYEIVYLEVNEVPNDPHKYFVEFEVISISNQLIDGSFTVSTDTKKSSSYIDYEVYMPYASNENELIIDLWLKNEYGGGLGNEILYMYLQKGDGEYELASVVGQTDNDGYVRVTYKPTESNENNTLYFDYRGNNTYNSSTSKRTSFKTELFEYQLSFTSNNITINTNKTTLNLTLQKTSLLDNTLIPIADAKIIITGTNGKIYTVITDENGEASLEVTLAETTTYTARYNDTTNETTVTITKSTPVMQLSQTFIQQGRVRIMKASLYDENENPLTENINDLTITFKRENGSTISTQPVRMLGGECISSYTVSTSVDEDIWVAELNGNEYYNGTTETYEEE